MLMTLKLLDVPLRISAVSNVVVPSISNLTFEISNPSYFFTSASLRPSITVVS